MPANFASQRLPVVLMTWQEGTTLILRLSVAAGIAVAHASVAAAATTPDAAPAPVVEKKICRSTLETGSLVKKHKVCLTSRQWRYVTDKSSDDARRYVDDNAGRPSCNDAATC